MPRKKGEGPAKRRIESYEHRDKERPNNPPAGLVTPETDPDVGQQKKRYAYDPHLDPQLVWAGKAEHTSFEVPTVSLHVHERIDPKTIIEAARKLPSPGGRGSEGEGNPLPPGEGGRRPGEGYPRYKVTTGGRAGFDYYYNIKTGQIESGGSEKIALWMLDTDYDGRSLYPRQVFFPMAGDDEGWARLARNLKAEIDPERIRAYWGTESLPFEAGEHKRIAVKIVDDRGVESLKVIDLPE